MRDLPLEQRANTRVLLEGHSHVAMRAVIRGPVRAVLFRAIAVTET